jgi:hypothetical protein
VNDKHNLLAYGLHLFALIGFAVFQPLFDILRRYPGFLVAHQMSSLEIILLILALVVFLPGAVWGIEAIARYVHPSLHGKLHLLFVAFFVALFVLPGIKVIVQLPGVVLLFLGAAIGLLAAVMYARRQSLRSLLSILGITSALLVGIFLFTKPVAKFLFTEQKLAATLGKVDANVPVFLLIFDELPLTSLLDEHARIDAVRYPAFAALGGDSYWFRNTSAVHNETLWAIPAILTGRYQSDRSLFPTVQDYPLNLFTLLHSTYELHVVETLTMLSPEATKGGDRDVRRLVRRMRAVFSDLYLVYLHIILPEDLTTHVSSVKDTWGGFAQKEGGGSQIEQFKKFVKSISPHEEPCLYFLHIMLPHKPWKYLPSGKYYSPDRIFGVTSTGDWGDKEWWVIQGYQRHLLQLALVDKLLGEFIARLKEVGLYDRSLLIVTADHGISFWPNQPRRRLVGNQHPEDVLEVPLFIKIPHQKEGVVDNRNVETIDILPTIADVLKVNIPWSLDGCSALAAHCRERTEKIAFDGWDERSELGERPHFPSDLLLRKESLRRKLSLFKPASGSEGDELFAVGPYANLVGHEVKEIGVKGKRHDMISLEPNEPTGSPLQGRDRSAAVFLIGAFSPVDTARETPYVAIAKNGTICAVAPVLTDSDGRKIFSALVPEGTVSGERYDLQFFVVEGPPERAELYQEDIA